MRSKNGLPNTSRKSKRSVAWKRGSRPTPCRRSREPRFHGALLVVAISEAIALGIVEPPRQADIVAMEAQSFGVPLGFGGPYCGVIATREQFVRQMPGRLVGQTVDRSGKRGFVLTLATREQHIRREKATSNICTNQALVALMANIFMKLVCNFLFREDV